MQNKRKLYIATCAILVLALAVIFIAGNRFYMRHVEESDLYQVMSEYRAAPHSPAPSPSFPEGSAEYAFLSGMELYESGDYAEAREAFEAAAALPSGDPALPAYLYYYLNECAYLLDGQGNYDTVARALHEAAQYAPLANDPDMLWDLASTIAQSAEGNTLAIGLLERYIVNAPSLELYTWARLKNAVAVLEYMNEEYARSIRSFYDVELELESAGLTPELAEELRYAQEYIANIHYIFEDYESAISRYQALNDSLGEDDKGSGFSYCLNMSTAYLELDDLENARSAALKLEEMLPYLDAADAPEVEANMHDVLAGIAIKKGELGEADAHLDRAEELYERYDSGLFIGGRHYVAVTRCEYLIRAGDTAAAQAVLEELLSSGDAAYYGLEKEVYELLTEVYAATGQHGELVEVYERRLEMNRDFARTTQREYLNFSQYYSDVKTLEYSNMRLSYMNRLAILVVSVIFMALVAAAMLAWLLRTKNVTDQLTGVYNRKRLNQLMSRYKRSGTPGRLGVVMMDIDYFKRYNDAYGHPAGDEALREVAKVLTESVRRQDLVIRYGGEEFLILLNGLEADSAEAVCQRIHRRLAERALPHSASDAAPYVTLSMGLCYQKQANALALDKLIEKADGCLYRSKEAGRNRLTTSIADAAAPPALK